MLTMCGVYSAGVNRVSYEILSYTCTTESYIFGQSLGLYSKGCYMRSLGFFVLLRY